MVAQPGKSPGANSGRAKCETSPQYSAGCALNTCRPLPTRASMQTRLIQCIHRNGQRWRRTVRHSYAGAGRTGSMPRSYPNSFSPVRGLPGRDFAVQVVLVAAHDFHVDELPGHEAGVATVLDLHHAVDLGRIGAGTGDRELAVDGVDDAALHAADLGLQARGADRRLPRHEPSQAFLFHFLWYRIGQGVGRSALHRRIGEGADAVQLCFVEEVEQRLELGFGLAGETDDEGRADGQLRLHLAPALHALQRLLHGAGPLHQLEDARAGVLERNVQVRQQAALPHQRHDVVDVRIRVDVMQAHPRVELRQAFAQCLHPRLVLRAAPFARRVFEIDAVGARVL